MCGSAYAGPSRASLSTSSGPDSPDSPHRGVAHSQEHMSEAWDLALGDGMMMAMAPDPSGTAGPRQHKYRRQREATDPALRRSPILCNGTHGNRRGFRLTRYQGLRFVLRNSSGRE